MDLFAHRFEAERLMVIIPDRLSDLLRKGEVTERYYNPGDQFREVHLVMTNDDQPDPELVQKMVGEAKLFLYNAQPPRRFFFRTLGWRPWLLRSWAEGVVELARAIRPQLIRCHGAHLNAFAAFRINRALGVRYVLSLHNNPDMDVRGRTRDVKAWLAGRAIESVEKIVLRNADLVLPVYLSILPYLKRLGVERYEVAYNVLNPSNLRRKEDYRLHDPVRVVSVSRQIKEKNPDNLIRAVTQLPNIRLTVVGDGPYHDYLLKVAEETAVADRVTFHRALPNDELCLDHSNYDIFAAHSDHWEISKSVLEALLTGLPVLINRRKEEPAPELTDDICLLVENTTEAYREGLERLIRDHAFREKLGRAAYARAQEHWSPEKTEANFVEIYRRVLAEETV